MTTTSTGYEAKEQRVDETDTETEATEINFNEHVLPHENALLKYDAVTWNFKLFTMSPKDYHNYQNGSTDVTELVISETGATGKFNIDEVVMTTIPAGLNGTKNSVLQQTTIQLSEQGSMTLFDELQAASLMLGYSQLMNVPLFLELTFVGFDSGRTNAPTHVPGTTKLWRLHINKVNTRLENTGATTVYDITCTSLTYNVKPEEWVLSEQITMIANSSVSAFIDEFSKKLNEAINTQYGYLTHMFAEELQANNFFTFHVHPQVGNLDLRNDSEKDAANDKASNKQQGTRTFVFKAGDSIGNVLDYIMDCAQARGVMNDNDTVLKRQFINIVPVSQYIGYDRLRKKHVYRYDVYVLPYRTVDYQDVDDTKNKNTAFDLKELLMEAHSTNKFNMKRYDYQWSGLNNEILDLELDFNSAYNVVTSRNVTSLFDRNNRKGVKAADFIAHDAIASPEEVQKLYLRKQELDSKQTRSEADNEELYLTEVRLNEATRVEGDDEQIIHATSGRRAFLEDIAKSVDLTTYTNTAGTNIAMNVPVDYSNMPEKSSSTTDSNEMQTEVAKRTIRSNYYNEATLMKLDMTVVGDPYWLGKGEHDTISDLRLLAKGQYPENDPHRMSANMLNCEPCFLLNMEPAKSYNEQTGIVQSDARGMLVQAVYRVQQVQSTFNGDGFKQELKAAIVARSINRKK